MTNYWYKVNTSFAQSCSAHPCGALVFRNGLEKWGYRLSNGLIAYRQFSKKSDAMMFVEDNDPKLPINLRDINRRTFQISESLNSNHIEKTEKLINKVEEECKRVGLRSARTMKDAILTKPTKTIPLSLASILDNIGGRSSGEFKIACTQAALRLKNIQPPSVVELMVETEL